jgi:dephospho-CoA kinase
MPQAPLIGIAGRARSGKDTVANFIIAAIGGYRYSFADPIRAMLAPLGVDMNDPYWQARKEDVIPALGVSPRRMMQTLGTEWGRNLINPDLWLVMAHQRLLRNGPGMVISDVRFENEAAWIRKHGGRIIHVIRPEAKAVEAHASEDGIEMLDTDAQLFNSGTLEELQLTVRELLRVYD